MARKSSPHRRRSHRRRSSHLRKRSIKRMDGLGTPLRRSPLRKSPKKSPRKSPKTPNRRRFGTDLTNQFIRSSPRRINDENADPSNRPVRRRSPTGRRFGTNLTNLRF